MTVLTLGVLGGEARDLQPLDTYRPKTQWSQRGERLEEKGEVVWSWEYLQRRKNKENLPGQIKLARINVHFFNTIYLAHGGSMPGAQARR